MRPSADAVLNNPVNAALRRYREQRQARPAIGPLAFPEDVGQAYLTLGTHPDLVARLWDELRQSLPVDCRAIFYGSPSLVRPDTGTVFGFAGGTHTYALRLPESERLEAARAGASRVMHYPRDPSFDLRDIGPEWMFCGWFAAEKAWCSAAYAYAGSAPPTSDD